MRPTDDDISLRVHTLYPHGGGAPLVHGHGLGASELVLHKRCEGLRHEAAGIVERSALV